jgi:hypothetical protein
MYHLLLEAFACLAVWPLGHDESVLLNIVAQSLLYNFLCADFFFSFSSDADDDCQWEVEASKC